MSSSRALWVRVVGLALLLGGGMVADAAIPQAGPLLGPDGIENGSVSRSSGSDLPAALQRIRRNADVIWVGYSVPAVSADSGMCCMHEDDHGDRVCGVCSLDRERNFHWNTAREDDAVVLEPPAAIRVMLRFEGGELDRVATFKSSCTIDATGQNVTWLDDVAAAESLAWLVDVAETGGEHEDGAVAAVAMHAGPAALARVVGWAEGRHPRKLREQAIFWLGAERSQEGWSTIARLARSDPDDTIRDRAVFAAHISEQPEAVDLLIQIARQDESIPTRRSALMWLGHRAGERATAALENALDDPDTEIKRAAVFGLSQLPVDEGVPLLIRIARTHDNPEVRKQALFWLGQSGDPRALDLIEEILLGG
ncbi:MAG: hypothetical protein GKS06_08380 [Acidobacteria bacterium]|nr:hypothetical protein [Acidobacteriota bacterium]